MKTFKLFSMAALALVMAACSSDDNEIQQPAEQGKMHFTATIAAPNSGATTRTTVTPGTGSDAGKYFVAWAVGDRIALVYKDSDGDRQKDEAEVTAVDPVTGAATISATLNHSVNDGEAVTLVYPSNLVSEATEDAAMGKSYTIDSYYFIQAGAAPTDDDFGIPKYDWRDGDGTFSVVGSDVTLSGNVTMNPNVAIWKLTLQDNATTPNALESEMMFITHSMNVATVLPATPASEYYVYVPIPILNHLKTAYAGYPLVITAVVGPNQYSYVHSGDLTLTAGKIYESTVTLKQVLMGWITDGVDGYNIFYIDGETWAQAKVNREDNWEWEIQDGKVWNNTKAKFLKNAAGNAYIDPTTAVDPSATYSWGD